MKKTPTRGGKRTKDKKASARYIYALSRNSSRSGRDIQFSAAGLSYWFVTTPFDKVLSLVRADAVFCLVFDPALRMAALTHIRV